MSSIFESEDSSKGWRTAVIILVVIMIVVAAITVGWYFACGKKFCKNPFATKQAAVTKATRAHHETVKPQARRSPQRTISEPVKHQLLGDDEVTPRVPNGAQFATGSGKASRFYKIEQEKIFEHDSETGWQSVSEIRRG